MIEVKNLVKKYGQNKAVDDISFTVNDGEILGFLGSNGAGKTTTMNIMTGFIAATHGDVLVDGMDIVEEPEKVKKLIGYLPDNPPLYSDLTVLEHLSFVYDLKGLPKKDKKVEIEKIMEQVKIKDMEKRLCKNLSKGYRQRAGLATAMLGNPKILVLDEPSSGLDPKQIIEMRSVVKKLSKNHTIILSSHILSEVSAICDRVMIINKGKIVAVDTPDNLGNKLSRGANTIVRIKGDKDKAINIIKNISFVSKVEPLKSEEEGTFDIAVIGQEEVDIREMVSIALVNNNIPLLMLKPKDVNLESIFLQITNDNLNLTKEDENIIINPLEEENIQEETDVKPESLIEEITQDIEKEKLNIIGGEEDGSNN